MASVRFTTRDHPDGRTKKLNALSTQVDGLDTATEALATKAELGAVEAAAQAGINGKEPAITLGTTAQYWRGDKSWQALDKIAVGLANVDNTSDASKPVSTAQQAALDLKINTSSSGAFGLTLLGAATVAAAKTSLGYTKADVGLANVDNTSDAAKPISAATQTALNTKEGTITAGTTSQYWRGDKTWQALAPVATSGSATNLTAGTLPAARMPALTGDVTTTVGTVATTIAAGAVTLAKMANVATGTIFYRKTAGAGAPEVQTLATLKTDLGLTGTNSGDQTITLTGDATGSGSGSFAVSLATVNANTGTYGGAGTVAQISVNGKGLVTGVSAVAITPTAIGLGNVDNTSDANKPVSTAQQAALDTKLNKAGGTMTGDLTFSVAGLNYIDGSLWYNAGYERTVMTAGSGIGSEVKLKVVTPADRGAAHILNWLFESNGSKLLELAESGIVFHKPPKFNGTVQIDGTNPSLLLNGDANSFYPNIRFRSLANPALDGTIEGYGGLRYSVAAAGAHTFVIGGATIATVSSAGLNVSGDLKPSGFLLAKDARFEGDGLSFSGTGVGVEMFRAGGKAYISSYDRTGNAYAPLEFAASSVKFAANSEFTGTVTVAGNFISQGSLAAFQTPQINFGRTDGPAADATVFYDVTNYYSFWYFRRWAAGAPTTQAVLTVADAGYYWGAANHIFRTVAGAVQAEINSTGLTVNGRIIANNFSSSQQGLVPASGGGTTKFLRADGTFTVPSDSDLRVFGGVGDGGTDNVAAFAAAEAALAAGEAIVISKGGYRIASNITITRPLKFVAGGRLIIPNGVTVTINGVIDAPVAQIFECQGTGAIVATGSNTGEAWVDWFGRGAADIERCVANFKYVRLGPWDYYADRTVVLDKSYREIRGSRGSAEGAAGTRIVLSGAAVATQPIVRVGTLDTTSVANCARRLNIYDINTIRDGQHAPPASGKRHEGVPGWLVCGWYESEMHNIFNHGSAIGYRVYGTVSCNMHNTVHVGPSTGVANGNPNYPTAHALGGDATSFGFIGANASLRVFKGGCAGMAGTNRVGLYLFGYIGDTWVYDYEQSQTEYGIIVDGRKSDGTAITALTAHQDVRVDGSILDNNSVCCLRVAHLNGGAGFQANGNYLAMGSTGIGMEIDNCMGVMHVGGGDFIGNSAVSNFGISINASRRVHIDGALVKDFTNPIKINASSQLKVEAVITRTGGGANAAVDCYSVSRSKFDCIIDGDLPVYNMGYRLDAGVNYCEFNVTAVNYGSFTTVAANRKIEYAGAFVATDAFGSGNIRTGVIG